jgi:hypothetical protein
VSLKDPCVKDLVPRVVLWEMVEPSRSGTKINFLRDWGYRSVVEHMPNMYEVLASIIRKRDGA